MGKEFILLGIHIITGRRVHRRRRREWQQKRQRHDKSLASKIYTTWAGILSDLNIFCTLRGGRTTAGSNAPGAFLVLTYLRFLRVRHTLRKNNIRNHSRK